MSGLRRVCSVAVLVCAVACGDDGPGAGSSETGGSDTSSGSTASPSTTISSTTIDPTTDGTSSSGSSEGTSSGSSSGSGSTGGDSSTGSSSSGTTGVADCRPLLVEVFYDAEGDDDELQWVKLYNPCGEEIDLSAWSIGYGGADYGPPRVKLLTGSIAAGGCYVVGGPTVAEANGNPVYQYADDFAPGLDLAVKVGGGIALFDLPDDEVDATTVPIDAVVYGPDNANDLIDETGSPVAAPHVANPPPGGSIQRTSEAATWITAETPAPNDCPPF